MREKTSIDIEAIQGEHVLIREKTRVVLDKNDYNHAKSRGQKAHEFGHVILTFAATKIEGQQVEDLQAYSANEDFMLHHGRDDWRMPPLTIFGVESLL